MIYASIVILTKNGEKYINEILKSIFNQKINKKFEVLIIDSGSKDRTLKIVKKYPVRLKLISSYLFNHGETRNLGARLAKGKYVVFLTQDATPANCLWLKNLLSSFEKDPLIVGTYSRHIPRKKCNPILARQIINVWPTGSSIACLKTKEDLELNKHNLPKIIHFSDSSSAINRDILQIFPFPKTKFAEDIQWELQVLKSGYKTFYNPESIIYHSHDYSLIEQLRQNYDHMRAIKKIFNYKRNKNNRILQVFNPIKFIITLYKDIIFILSENNFNFIQKIKWIFYSPFWHFFIYSGVLLGLFEDRLPFILERKLSRQERIKEQ